MQSWISFDHEVDGIRLNIRQFAANGLPNSPGREVVILCCGFGNNVLVYDLLGESSLASFLSQNNFDVWSFDLRGHGSSTSPPDRKWTMGSYVFEDAVHAIQFVAQRTGVRKVAWIGHSMGGMIGLSLASHSSTSELLSSVCTLSSSIYCGNGLYWWALNFSPAYPLIYCLGGLELGRHTHAVSSTFWLTSYCVPYCGCAEAVASRENTGRARVRELLDTGFCYEPLGVVRDIKTCLGPDGLTISIPIIVEADVAVNTFKVKDHIGTTSAPLCIIYGTEDIQIPENDVLRLVDDVKRNSRNGAADLRVLAVGKRKGHGRYSHFDPICGDDAPTDVFPFILNFLKQETHYDADERALTENTGLQAV